MDMNRHDFLKLTSGIVSGLGIAGTAEANEPGPVAEQVPDESYLVLGLTAMARSRGWFNAHWGAGILAGYYLCRENGLDARTVAAIKTQMDAAIKVRAKQFERLPAERADPALTKDIAEALKPAMRNGVRSGGHAVIFASLALRALKDKPDTAQPALVKALCEHSRSIAGYRPKRPKVNQPYEDTQEMVEALFTNLVRFHPLVGHPSVRRPNFTHMTTHTEALMNLDAMGYRDLARAGHPGHRAHLDEPVPDVPGSEGDKKAEATLERIMQENYWRDPDHISQWKRPQQLPGNRNGHWLAAGHLFKLLYSYHRLIGLIENREQVQVSSAVLLERYFNPAVQGG